MRSEVFPIGVKLEGRPCLVVGTGDEAEKRTERLVRAGAQVRVVSETPTEALERFAASGTVVLAKRPFEEADLDDVWLAVYTDMDTGVAARIMKAAEARRVLFCAVDRPAQSSYVHLAIATVGPVTVAVSTSGRAPSLASRLRDEIARILGEAKIAEFADGLARLRDRTPPERRRSILGDVLRGLRFDGQLSVPGLGEGDGGPEGRITRKK
jgi:siroheme synthase-like protein